MKQIIHKSLTVSTNNSQIANQYELADFGRRLRDIFGGVQNKEIAARLGVSRPAVTAYLQGRIPSAEKLIEISALTGCNLHWLLTGEGPKRLADHSIHEINKAKVLLFHCSKGGVGTSTAALLTAIGLADRGYKTLLIDTMYGSCTLGLFLTQLDGSNSYPEQQSGLRNLNDFNRGLLVNTPVDKLDLMVVHDRYKSMLLRKKIRHFELMPEEARQNYSFIVIDTHSRTDPFNPSNLFAAPLLRESRLFIPYEPHNSDVTSVQTTLDYVRSAKRYSRDIEFSGLFINLYDSSAPLNIKLRKEVESLVGGNVLKTVIHRSQYLLVKTSEEMGNFYKTESSVAEEYKALIDEILQTILEVRPVGKNSRKAS